MAQVGGKGVFQTWIFSRFTLFALLAMCLYVGWSVFERYTVEREMAARRGGLESEYFELQERRDSLFEKVDYLKGDSGRESEIRKHFDVAHEGEQVVIIVDDTPDETASFVDGISPEANTGTPWWQFWH